MPCSPVPKIPLPTPPSGLTIAAPIPLPAIPDVPGTPCCLLPTLPAPSLGDLLPPGTINPAFLEVIHRGLDFIEAYVESIPLDCPRS